MRLKLAAAASASSSRSSPAGTSASVVTTAIIVPRSGRIIAAPFAIAPSRTSPPGSASVRCATLGVASVVQIASAAAAPPSGASSAAAARMPASTRSMGSGTPITPVDATSTSCGSAPTSSPASAVMRSASVRPCAPVAAFALPLETTIARARPALRSSDARLVRTGAPAAALRVKRPAACAGASATTRATSGRPLALMPARTPAARKPRGNVAPTATGRAPAVRRPRPGPARGWRSGSPGPPRP